MYCCCINLLGKPGPGGPTVTPFILSPCCWILIIFLRILLMRPESGRQPLRVSLLYIPGRRDVPPRRSESSPRRPESINPRGRHRNTGTRLFNFLCGLPLICLEPGVKGRSFSPPLPLSLPHQGDLKNLKVSTWRGRLSGRGKKKPQTKRAGVTPNHSLGRPFISTAFSFRLFQSEG